MTSPIPPIQTLLDRAADAVARARAAGADAAEAEVRIVSAQSIGIRLGKLEEVDRSETSDIALTVFVGQRSASVSTGDHRPEALDALVERAVAMARLAPEDPWVGLAPADLLISGVTPDLDLFDPDGDPDPALLRAMALEAEDAARAVTGVTNSDGASAAANVAAHALVTSNGFARGYATTGYTLSAIMIAGEGGDMQRDYAYHSARHRADLEGAASIGRRAGERAVARLYPASMSSGSRPVLFDPRVGTSLVGHVVSAMAGPSIARRRSFLADRPGAQLFPAGITIVNDPLRPRHSRSHPFDAEGLPVRRHLLVDQGVIGPWLTDLASARQLGSAPTGHSGGGGGISTGALTLLPGTMSRAALMADVKDGVLVTELVGQGVNGLTGDYSRAAAGFRIVDGELAGPVSSFTIAGNLTEMFADLRAADDLDTSMATEVPTLRTDSMTIAGG